MKRAALTLAALVLLLGCADWARAGLITSGDDTDGGNFTLGPDPLINFSFSDIFGDTATGLLTTSSLGGGQYLATGGTLTVTGPAAGLYTVVPGGPAVFFPPGFQVNNVIYPSLDPVLDVFGLALVDGSSYLNIWGISPGNYEFGVFDGVNYTVLTGGGPASVTASVVPEPATLMLLGAGLSALGLVKRRRA